MFKSGTNSPLASLNINEFLGNSINDNAVVISSGIEKKIRNCQIECNHRLHDSPKLYKGTASGEIWQ